MAQGVPASRVLIQQQKVLANAGAKTGSIYARLSDPEIYRAILDHDFGVFLGLTEEFAQALERYEALSVAGDAIEGFNPAHDVCRLIINAAVNIVRQRHARLIVNKEFLLVGRHDSHPDELRSDATWLQLGDEALERKLKMARGFDELKTEIDAALEGDLHVLRRHPELSTNLLIQHNSIGLEAYRIECLRPAQESRVSLNLFRNQLPFYEHYGERGVAQGNYERVIRFHEHILPIADALEDFAGRAERGECRAKATAN
ncbi:MAG TPA: hypothetical protein VIV66_13360 [Pyrinomonadaceae bacterium]